MVDLTKLRRLMEKAGIDVLLTIGPKNAMYITGDVHFERYMADAHGLVPLIPVYVAADESASFTIGGLFEQSKFPGEMFGREDLVLEKRLQTVAEQIKRRGLEAKTIGVDMDNMPASALLQLRELLPAARFVSSDLIMADLRAVKSEEEVGYMKMSNSVAEQAFKDVIPMIRDGVSYADVGNAWAKAAIEHGAFPIWILPYDLFMQQTPVLPPASPTLARYPTHAQKGVMTRLDIGCVYKGYYCDQKIVICPGQPSAESMDIYNSHRARQEFMRATIRPGMTKRQAWDIINAEFKDQAAHPFWFHGVGLDYHEEPRFGTFYSYAANLMQELTFAPGNVLALEPSWLVEDSYVLREDGFERLSQLPQEVMIL